MSKCKCGSCDLAFTDRCPDEQAKALNKKRKETKNIYCEKCKSSTPHTFTWWGKWICLPCEIKRHAI